MSSGAQVALLGPRVRRDSIVRLRAAPRSGGRWVPVAAFAALGLDGAIRWSSLLSGSGSELRLLALLGIATALVCAGLILSGVRRLLLVPLTAVAVLGTFAASGLPLAWIEGVRVAVSARAIGQGLDALPRLLVPYLGINQWVRMVIVLGAGLLLIGGAVMLTLALRDGGMLRRALAAVPLIALEAVPTTLVHPRFAYVEGLVVFTLLAALLWGDRVDRREAPAAVLVCAVVAAGAMVLAPALDRHRPWINYRTLTSHLTPVSIETFDWQQSYGPIVWPRTGETVFDVQARRPDYWKAENLDVFDGYRWTAGSLSGESGPLAGVGTASLRRWTQTLKVTVAAMQSTDVVAAGAASAPTGLSGTLVAGTSPGTWTEPSALGNGDSYLVKVYDPEPSPSQLSGAGVDYPGGLLPAYLMLSLPASALNRNGGAQPATEPVLIAPFHSTTGATYGGYVSSPAIALDGSPYSQAYALAGRMAARASTPYAFVLAVERYLAGSAYTYDEHPPQAKYPLESFLFASGKGYCQQFAGAMALLLRLGGVPARVAVGFTTGTRDNATHQWIVSDADAHAWVEAYFPGYGWVRFDPTPAADPALGGEGQSGALLLKGANFGASGHGTANDRAARANSSAGLRGRGSALSWPLLTLLVVLGLGALVAAAVLTRPASGIESMVAELERAFARSGRPLKAGTTLAMIERRLASSIDAAAYVRALRAGRFAGEWVRPAGAERRAVRAELRRGLGIAGRIRAWWALPPRRGG